MTKHQLVVLGTGGHASVVIDLARAAGVPVKGCAGPGAPEFGPDFGAHLGNDEALNGLDPARVELSVGVGSIGNSDLRRRLYEKGRALGFTFAKLAHPRAIVAESAALGEGVQVMAGAVVQPFAAIGCNVIINTGAIIEHHCRIGDHALIAPGAVVCGGASVGEEAHIGANSTVLQGRTVGARCMVGAGAVVVNDVADGRQVKGVPAA